MSDDNDSQREDVAGLFRKFGGDVRDYKEFAPRSTEPVRSAGAWALLNGARPGAAPHEEAAPPAAPAPVTAAAHAGAATAPAVTSEVPPPFSPAPALARAPALPHAPALASAAAASALPDLAPPRELDALFHRLAGAAPVAVPAQGLMARWRRPA